MNQHTNNAKYLQWLFDSVDYQSFSIGNIKEIIINYLSQAKEGDEYAIFTEETGPTGQDMHIYQCDGEKEYCAKRLGG
jgi:acyl-ACP thioesterase